ncbi:heterogeneous nuclear ribonucleoprotein K homolog isoform X2 [Corticium candelabrum]|uniref:heterogeneous nuclear ribonucleoprotein K homolog isoform X2 n=1 Tax=Corticium candelabrum TaxID=121492 RepID=UPI002E26B4F8|nr:heterogeneous nuclear ribonucleoprotein K homolog isoform X2 [Corticium candelabrum]
MASDGMRMGRPGGGQGRPPHGGRGGYGGRGRSPGGRGPPSDRKRPYGGGGGGGRFSSAPKRSFRGDEFRPPQPGEIYLRFLVRSKDGGGIIGKGGQNIKRLREEHKAYVSIPDSHGAPERVLTVAHAELSTVMAVMREIVPKLEGDSQEGGRREHRGGSGRHEVQMMVPQDQVGSIIGRAGFKIKELRERCGAFIKVFSDPLPASSERLLVIQGNVDQIVNGLESVVQIMMESPSRIDVRYYHPSVPMDLPPYPEYYGGYDDMGMGPPPRPPPHGGYDRGYRYDPPPPAPRFRGGPPPVEHQGRGLGRRGPPMEPGQPRMQEQRAPSMSAPRQSVGQSQPPVAGYGPDFVPSGPDIISQQVTIPNDLAGAIIGRGGEKIRHTRLQSGCGIKMEASTDDPNDRIITITGTAANIQYAQSLLQQSVRQDRGPNSHF